MDIIVTKELLKTIAEKNNNKNSSEEASQTYRTLYGYYDAIKKISTYKELISFRSQLIADHSAALRRYDRLYAMYKEFTRMQVSLSERNKIAIKINEYAVIAESIEIFVNIINKHIVNRKFVSTKDENTAHKPEVKEGQKPVQKSKPEVKKVQKPITQTRTDSVEEYNRAFLTDDNALEYLHYCRDIKEDYKNLSGLQFGSKEASALQKKLYNDRMKRRKFIQDKFASSDNLDEIYSHLYYIESQERLIYMEKKELNIPEEDLNFRECVDRITAYLNEISELHFSDNPDTKKISDVTGKYENLIKSIDEVAKSRDIKDMLKDLLNLVSTFNIDGDYSKFKKHYNNDKIGTEKVSRKMYEENISNINSKLQGLFNLLNKALINKNVHVKSHEKTFKEKEMELYKHHYRICNGLLGLNLHRNI